MLVMANAWDAGSARAFEAAGFPAVATTSGGVAQALGYRDHEDAPPEEMLAAAARIVRAVQVPVTVDLEAGYGLAPEEVVRRVVDVGAVGMNLEDTDHRAPEGAPRMRPAEEQAEFLAAVRAAADAAGVDLVLNARVDSFIQRAGTLKEHLTDALHRGRLYREAGADCIYPIILSDEPAITALVEAVGPVNITMRRNGPLTLARLAALGVRRVTYATSLYRDTMAAVEQMAGEIASDAAEAARG
jgi:2-methylisocitrate lyase-like PEP mutase family enzyme